MMARPTVHDLLAMRGSHQYAMLRVETIEEAERDVAKESIVNGSNSTAIYKCERIK